MRFDHPPNIQLRILDTNPFDPKEPVWLWTKTCGCGAPIKDTYIGTEDQARLDAAVAVCSTCFTEAMA